MDVPPSPLTSHPPARFGRPLRPRHRSALVGALLLLATLAMPGAAAQGGGQQIAFAEALELAAEAPAVVAARRQVALSERALTVAGSPVTFEASGGYAITRGELNDPTLPEPESLDTNDVLPIELSASLAVIPYGPGADAIADARDALENARDQLAAQLAQSRIDAASAFLAALRADADAALASQALELARQRLDAAQARAAVGAVTVRELDALGTEVDAARIDLEGASRTAELARAELALLLGLAAPPTPVDATPPTGTLPADLAALLAPLQRGEGFAAEALGALDPRGRSDARAALRSLDAAERDYAAGIRTQLPVASLSLGWDRLTADSTVSLGGAFDTAGFQPSLRASFDPDSGLQNAPSDDAVSDRFRVQLGLRVPLDPTIGAALDANRITLERSREQAALTLERARLEALRSLDALASAERQLELAALRAEQAQRSAADASERLALGLIGPLEARAAELDAARSELADNRATDAFVLAQMRFLAALGRSPMEVFR